MSPDITSLEEEKRFRRLKGDLISFTVALLAYSSLLLIPFAYLRIAQERPDTTPFGPLFPMAIAIFVVCLHVARDRLSPEARAIILCLLCMSAGVAGLLVRGILEPAIFFFVLAVLCLNFVLTMRQIVVVSLVVFGVAGLITYFHFGGHHVIQVDPKQVFAAPAAWIMSLLVALYLVGVIAFTSNRYRTMVNELLLELDQERQQVTNLAFRDTLTGLLNLRALTNRAEPLIAQAARGKINPAVLFLDLDHFKAINDEFGHASGDEVLVQVAERLLKTVRQSDTLIRLGGDEFLVFIPDAENAEELEHLITRLRGAVFEPMQIDTHSLQVGISVGAARYPEQGGDLDALMRNADDAMYQDKARRRGRGD